MVWVWQVHPNSVLTVKSGKMGSISDYVKLFDTGGGIQVAPALIAGDQISVLEWACSDKPIDSQDKPTVISAPSPTPIPDFFQTESELPYVVVGGSGVQGATVELYSLKDAQNWIYRGKGFVGSQNENLANIKVSPPVKRTRLTNPPTISRRNLLKWADDGTRRS
jgi:hypothetical protein